MGVPCGICISPAIAIPVYPSSQASLSSECSYDTFTVECNSVSLLAKRTRQSSISIETDVLLRTIREAREAAGLSQREVGKRIGFHPTMYHKIEIGARVLDVVEFVNLSRAIGVDPMELFGSFLINLQRSRLEPEP
ncbi:MAG: hypothetical protein HONBIEJF_00028 [Fimbriimonadaceae bacterium]|nr:hypothetical protein [Fimbriimonadaceae bacterium]